MTTGSAPRASTCGRMSIDHDRRLVRYRAKASICNACPRKEACTDSSSGREVIRPLDPWPHSEAGRFHRGLSLVLVALSLLMLVVAGARNHDPGEAGLLGVLLVAALLVGRMLGNDFRAHPSNFPARHAALGARFTGRKRESRN